MKYGLLLSCATAFLCGSLLNAEVKKIESYEEYEEYVDNAGDKLMVIMTTMPNCTFCVKTKKPLERASEAYKDDAVFFTLDERDVPEFIQEIGNIKGYPTTVFMKKGKEIKREEGNMEDSDFSCVMDRLLNKASDMVMMEEEIIIADEEEEEEEQPAPKKEVKKKDKKAAKKDKNNKKKSAKKDN